MLKTKEKPTAIRTPDDCPEYVEAVGELSTLRERRAALVAEIQRLESSDSKKPDDAIVDRRRLTDARAELEYFDDAIRQAEVRVSDARCRAAQAIREASQPRLKELVRELSAALGALRTASVHVIEYRREMQAMGIEPTELRFMPQALGDGRHNPFHAIDEWQQRMRRIGLL
jgi:hypothetical protein